MRIIGGKYSRRVIKPPANLPVRPTTDLAKESLFNILQHKTPIEGRQVLDLFSGTGALSFEFASRGSTHIIAVEQNYQCVRFIRNTANLFGMDQLRVVKMDVFRFLKIAHETYDIIVADPPYDLPDIERICRVVDDRNLLNPGGWMVVEHGPETILSDCPNFVEHRKYGHVNFSFFQRFGEG